MDPRSKNDLLQNEFTSLHINIVADFIRPIDSPYNLIVSNDISGVMSPFSKENIFGEKP